MEHITIVCPCCGQSITLTKEDGAKATVLFDDKNNNKILRHALADAGYEFGVSGGETD